MPKQHIFLGGFLLMIAFLQITPLMGQVDTTSKAVSIQVCNPVPEKILVPGSIYTAEFYVPIDSLADNNCSLESFLYKFYFQSLNTPPLGNLKISLNGKAATPHTPICEIPPPYSACKVSVSGVVPRKAGCGEVLTYQFVFETFVKAKNTYLTLCSTPLKIKISPCASLEGPAHLCNEYQTVIRINAPEVQHSNQYVWKFSSPDTDWLIDGKRGNVVTNRPEVTVTYVGNKNSVNTLSVAANNLLNQPEIRLTKSVSYVRKPDKLIVKHIEPVCGYAIKVVPIPNTTLYEWGIGSAKPDFKTAKPELGGNILFPHGTKKVIFVRARNECGVSDWYSQELRFPDYPADHQN